MDKVTLDKIGLVSDLAERMKEALEKEIERLEVENIKMRREITQLRKQ
jgi:cell division protein FtsB|tara:strand:+ start:741 stop:884 length:144 start_codon:yes stop_codon:yes gene_type:complete